MLRIKSVYIDILNLRDKKEGVKDKMSVLKGVNDDVFDDRDE